MSDKHIVQKSGILANLLPGDIVMADRGFRIDEDVAFYYVVPNSCAVRNNSVGWKIHPN